MRICFSTICSGYHLHVQYMYLYVKREFFIHVCTCTCKWVLILYRGYFLGGGLNFHGFCGSEANHEICTHETVPGRGGLEYRDHNNYATNWPKKIHYSRKFYPPKNTRYTVILVCALLSFYVIYSTCTVHTVHCTCT